MTIMNTLSRMGFEARPDGGAFWGIGSLVWGHTVRVTPKGHDLYEVKSHDWLYGPDGEPLQEEEHTSTLHGGLALARAIEALPASYWRR